MEKLLLYQKVAKYVFSLIVIVLSYINAERLKNENQDWLGKLVRFTIKVSFILWVIMSIVTFTKFICGVE